MCMFCLCLLNFVIKVLCCICIFFDFRQGNNMIFCFLFFCSSMLGNDVFIRDRTLDIKKLMDRLLYREEKIEMFSFQLEDLTIKEG